ncbi:MAG TPA: phosphatase PAP2 family protein [Nitrospirota bacterium]|nr:phosphatase PAP2 family protein [Nitrospirota bacterium]
MVVNPPTGPITAYRRYWLPELVVLAAAALGSIILFAATDLDITTIRPFYHPDLAEPWPVANHPVWSLFYQSAPWVTASLALAGTALSVAGSLREQSKRLRLYGIFILLCVVVGPGLVINVALKDHWGRPRPRQITEFGGRLDYAQPFVPTGAYGKSFPCGHCSVGYLYAAGWWVWRRRRPALDVVSLVCGLVLGTLLGIGRMAAGAHFLSDAVWSALLAYGIAHALYYYALRVPAREDGRAAVYPLILGSRHLKTTVIAGAVLTGLLIIGGGMLANPYFHELRACEPPAGFPPPRSIEILVDQLDVELHLIADAEGGISCSGTVHGFGLPGNGIDSKAEFRMGPVPVLRYRVLLEGWFTDIDGVGSFRVPVREVRSIMVRAGRGDITVVDETGGHLTAKEGPALDLHTVRGRVRYR